MLYVPMKHLKEGMKLGNAIKFSTAEEALISQGQILTTEWIAKLKKYKVIGAYIDTPATKGIVVNELINAEEKEKIASELKDIYDDYIENKQISMDMVASVHNTTNNLMDIIMGKREHLLNVIDIKDYDNYTYSHSIYVGTLSLLTGLKLGLPMPQLKALTMAGILHDVGKLDVPIEIVTKKGTLTIEERRIIEKHPVYAAQRLSNIKNISTDTVEGIYTHHEWLDGSGYPNHIAGENIPLFGRIIALADVFDALTSARSYRQAWHTDEVIEYMMGSAVSHFDINIMHTFLKVIAAYPVGSVIRLSDNTIAVVEKNSEANILRPTIRILEPGLRQGFEKGMSVNLSDDHEFINITIIGTMNGSQNDDEMEFTIITK